MRLTIKNKEIKLNKREVRSAKKIISNFLDKIKNSSRDNLCPTYYFTMLIVMHTMSQSLLNELNADTLRDIMEKLGTKE